jgi:fructosamine-3-kinase
VNDPRAALDGLGLTVRSLAPLGGAHRAELADGRTVVAKSGAPGQAATEAAGLRWLAVPGGPPVPEVIAADGHWLVTAHVPGGRLDASGAERFGRELAAMHAAGAASFGAPAPGGSADAWIGTAPMRNEPAADWPAWYAEHRVLPYLRRASLAAADAAAVHRVCERIDELAGPPETPARLHGDLWSGNVHPGADGRVWVLDPAAHGGHRETDLAMLALFGAPQLDRILAGYDEAAPLASGWRQRVGLHQLFPLLVHAVLFGGGYGASAGAAARAALR